MKANSQKQRCLALRYEDIMLRRSESSDFDGVVGEGKHL